MCIETEELQNSLCCRNVKILAFERFNQPSYLASGRLKTYEGNMIDID